MKKAEKKTKVKLVGGPYNGNMVLLSVNGALGTLEFTARGFTGSYKGGVWSPSAGQPPVPVVQCQS